jgi:hydrogenase nickel incorporation protein HypB
VLISTTEGEDKPLKYPTIFNTADVAVITKLDMAEAAGIDLELLVANIDGVRPGMPTLQVSARTGEGIEDLEQFLISSHTELDLAHVE